MKMIRDNWVFVCGQANAGKTFWIKKHLEKIPAAFHKRVFIYDFNSNDYQEFEGMNIWNVQEGNQEEIESFMKKVYKQGNCLAVFDEADNYFLFPSDMIRRFVNTARNRGIGAFVNAKRSKSIQPVYRNRFTHLVIFRTSLPEDIKYLEQWAGVQKGDFSYLRNLAQGEFIEIDLTNNIISGVKKL